jgi:hypothetical protein
MQPLAGVGSVSDGASHGCAARANNSAACWRTGPQGHIFGQLGNDSGAPPLFNALPVMISPTLPLTGVTSMAAGNATIGLNTSCAVLSDTSIRCWGDLTEIINNGVARLSVYGGPITTDGTTPLLGVVGLSISFSLACALVDAGAVNEVRCWGTNASGGAGTGTQTRVRYPTRVDGLVNPSAVRVTGESACALDNGVVKCWGRNGSGECGVNTTDPIVLVPTVVRTADGSMLGGVSAIETGWREVCALRTSGELYCWGEQLSRRFAAPYTGGGAPATGVAHLGGAATPRFATSDGLYHLGATTRVPNCGTP